MAVPKKRSSKARSHQRKAVWKQKAKKAREKAWSLGKSILSQKKSSFLYETN